MKVIYKTSVIATGGDKGRIQSKSGNIKFSLSDFKKMDADLPSTCTAPEELLAATISAYYTRSVKDILSENSVKLKRALSVTTHVVVKEETDKAFSIQITLDCFLLGLTEELAMEILHLALNRCPILKVLKKDFQIILNLIQDNDNVLLY